MAILGVELRRNVEEACDEEKIAPRAFLVTSNKRVSQVAPRRRRSSVARRVDETSRAGPPQRERAGGGRRCSTLPAAEGTSLSEVANGAAADGHNGRPVAEVSGVLRGRVSGGRDPWLDDVSEVSGPAPPAAWSSAVVGPRTRSTSPCLVPRRCSPRPLQGKLRRSATDEDALETVRSVSQATRLELDTRGRCAG